MSHDEQMNSNHIHRNELHDETYQSSQCSDSDGGSSHSSSRDDDVDHIQQQLFGDWSFAYHERESSNTDPTLGSLCGPRGEMAEETEERSCQMTTGQVDDATSRATASPRQVEQHAVNSARSWPAALDLPRNPQVAPAQPQPATFGLEFEFLVPVERRNFLREPPDPGRYFIPLEEYRTPGVPPTYPAQIFIAEVLNDAQLLAVANLDRYDAKDPMLYHRLAANYYSVWRVQGDSTVRPDTTQERLFRRWQLFGLEINSPKLRADEGGFREVRRVLGLVRENVRVSLSTSCGLHVHVDASALAFPERQHVVCLYLLVEDVLFSFCAPHRRDSTWCMPTARHSLLADYATINRRGLSFTRRCPPLRPRGQPRVARAAYEQHYVIQRLWATRNMRRLLDQAPSRPGTRTALAIKSVGRASEDEDKWRFEFRHFQGTLDPDVAKQWTRICVALVLAAKGLGEYGTLLANMAYNKFHEIGSHHRLEDQAEARGELLQILGLEDAADFWERQVLSYQTQGGWLQGELGPDGFAPVLEETGG